MAVFDLPADLLISRMSWQEQLFEVHTSGPFGSRTLTRGAPFWAVSIEVDRMNEYQSGPWKALLMKLRGSINQLAVYDVARPVPLGTLRGTGIPFVLDAPVAVGDTTMTLRAGTSNLLTFPEAFDNAVWPKNGTTVTPNAAVAPDGTMTADLVAKTATSTSNVRQDVTNVGSAGATLTGSVHAKAGSLSAVSVAIVENAGGSVLARYIVSLVNGAITVGTPGQSISVRPLPNGWFWIAVTDTGSGAFSDARLYIYPDNYTNAVAGDVYLWGAKLEVGPAATDYGFGKTLLQGDLLGIGSGVTQQVVILTDDALSFSEGRITVNFEHPMRNAFTAGTQVQWDRPKALFRRQNPRAGWDYESVFASGFALDLLEDPR